MKAMLKTELVAFCHNMWTPQGPGDTGQALPGDPLWAQVIKQVGKLINPQLPAGASTASPWASI